MIPFEIQLARSNLKRHPWHTLAMVVGMALAVLVMVYIPSTMSSFYDDLIDRAVEQNSAHLTVWPVERQPGRMTAAMKDQYGQDAMVAFTDRTFPRHRDLNGYHALMARVEEVPGVVAAAAFVEGSATVNYGNLDLGIQVEGIDPRDYGRVVNIAAHFPGKELPKLGPSDIAIGFRMAEKLGVHEGAQLHVTGARADRLLRVRAIFRSGYYDKDLRTAFVSLKTAQRLFQMGNEVSGVAARCWALDRAGEVSRTVQGRMNNKVRNWMDDNASLLAEIKTIDRVTFFINVLVAMVASVGMANVFNMFVHSRQKELAIMRAVGSSRFSLRSILLLEATWIWFVGTLVGCTMALAVMAFEQSHPYAVSEETYGIGSYATQPKLAAFAAAVSLAAATMLVSAWWSGRRAAKLRPVEVIFGR